MNCWSCAKELPAPPWYRGDECPHCAASLHVCKQCGHYSPGKNNECDEPQADFVADKERDNFCDWFTPGSPSTGAADADKQKTLAALEALFKK